MRRHRKVEETAATLAARSGFAEIATPIFEFTEVFGRSLGDTSDIVSKEMYTFADKGGDSLTLRPEGTAGVVRAFISGRLHQQLPFKGFYRGPMFRHERPQKGRLRQFHQIGVELLGAAEPLADVEVIALGYDILTALGVADLVQLEINTLGDGESRDIYRQRLVDYLRGHSERLSEDSQLRLERNPLRILDSKDPTDRAVIEGAPAMSASLTDAAKQFFDRVCEGLTALGVAFQLNERLVRGLDYYCHTAFEFTTDALGSQGAVLAGGRYDGLVAALGGPATPGVGWAAGVERLAMLIAEPDGAKRPLVIAPLDDGRDVEVLTLAQRLRRAGFTVEVGFSGNLGKRMKRANRLNARAAILIGGTEGSRGAAVVRDMETGEQVEVPLDSLDSHLERFR
ncbi:MAG: histidine--tRNA ligase [Rhodospirillales bacterium]|nr:histidine--tRNA ligase [Rhodospirillales bacterium]